MVMMFVKSIILLGSAIVLLANITMAAELLEMNDANRNRLPLDVGKGLDVVQSAMENEYKFLKIDDVTKFLENCKIVRHYLASAKDEDWEGLAGKIKTIMSDSKLSELCTVKPEEVTRYRLIDNSEAAIGALSKNVLDKLQNAKLQIEADPKLKILLGYMCEIHLHLMGEDLLQSAGHTIDVLFGEQVSILAWTNSMYKTECELRQVKPICKFVRRTERDDVVAYGVDFAEMIPSLSDESKLAESSHFSGVKLEEVKKNCNLIKVNLLPVRALKVYKEYAYVNEEQISDRLKVDAKFSFYYHLNEMCTVLA